MAMIMAKEDFEELVAVALDTIPAELAELIDNCVVLVEDFPPPDVLPDTLGLYTGDPADGAHRVLFRPAGHGADLP